MKSKAKSTRLFDTFSENLAWVLSRVKVQLNIEEFDKSERLYACPLSLLVFSHKSIRVESDDMLTLEHVPPKSLRGKGICLTAKNYNNTASELDVLLNSRVHVFNAYENNAPLETQAKINGFLNVKMEWSERNGKPHFKFSGNLNYPAVKELISDIKSGKEFKVETAIPKNYLSSKTKVSIPKNAYLLAFSKIGYELIFGMKRRVHPFYDKIRQVIHEKDDSFDLWFVQENNYPEQMEGICFIITETKRIALSICFQINSTLKVQVFLPCPEDDDLIEQDIFPNNKNYRYYSINQFLPIVGREKELDKESYWNLFREFKSSQNIV